MKPLIKASFISWLETLQAKVLRAAISLSRIIRLERKQAEKGEK